MSDDRTVLVENFTTDELPAIRDLVKQAALDAGLSEARTADLVLVVNELAANAILHAGGTGSLTVAPVPDGLAVEVSDRGPGLPIELPSELPDPGALGGRGLWLVRRLGQQVTFRSSPRGASVRLVVPRA